MSAITQKILDVEDGIYMFVLPTHSLEKNQLPGGQIHRGLTMYGKGLWLMATSTI